MSQVLVVTEQVYRNRTYTQFIPPIAITADQLVDVLNSCAEPGTEWKEYVLIEDSCRDRTK
jgi:hypothetical protein